MYIKYTRIQVLDGVMLVAGRAGEGAICCMLAAAELVGGHEEGPAVEALQRCDVVQNLMRDLHLRALLRVETPMKDSQYVGTRKLLSALHSLASSDVHKVHNRSS
jgi:hypothetical protein